MPWSQDLGQVLSAQQMRGFITDTEYESIRKLLKPEIAEPEKFENLCPTMNQTTRHNSGFKFGEASRKELIGVNVDLVRVTHLALKYSLQDFCVFDGLRTAKEQMQHVKNGTSRTMQSEHMKGLAVDLVPWINGKPVWDWDGCYKIACAVDRAATELGVADRITWGGAWDRRLSDYGGDPTAYAREVQEYQRRHAGADFIDGPHYQIRKV